jgi:hypothetical protein
MLCPYLQQHHPDNFLLQTYNPAIGIGYVFYANLTASLITIPLLWKEISGAKNGFDSKLWKELWCTIPMNYRPIFFIN